MQIRIKPDIHSNQSYKPRIEENMEAIYMIYAWISNIGFKQRYTYICKIYIIVIPALKQREKEGFNCFIKDLNARQFSDHDGARSVRCKAPTTIWEVERTNSRSRI